MNKEELIYHWTSIGKLLHYPRCCINYFCEIMSEKDELFQKHPRQIQEASNILKKYKKTFIPCPICAAMIIKDVVKYLQRHRNIVEDGKLILDGNTWRIKMDS